MVTASLFPVTEDINLLRLNTPVMMEGVEATRLKSE